MILPLKRVNDWNADLQRLSGIFNADASTLPRLAESITDSRRRRARLAI
jgi:hypothetical protein